MYESNGSAGGRTQETIIKKLRKISWIGLQALRFRASYRRQHLSHEKDCKKGVVVLTNPNNRRKNVPKEYRKMPLTKIMWEEGEGRISKRRKKKDALFSISNHLVM